MAEQNLIGERKVDRWREKRRSSWDVRGRGLMKYKQTEKRTKRGRSLWCIPTVDVKVGGEMGGAREAGILGKN